jgi:hypothetical protein
VPAARVQVADEGVKVPVEFVVKLTVPVGVVGLDDPSVMVAVQLVAVPEVTELGVHDTLVVVLWGGTGVAAIRNVPWLVA